VTAADIAMLVRGVEVAAFRLGVELDEVLDAEHISAQVGIAANRVRELLDGAEPQHPPRDALAREAFYREMVSGRLGLLRARRPDSYRQIGHEVNLTHTVVEFLVKGKRSARVEFSSPLEEHYGVEHGYLSKPEGVALADHLKKIVDGLRAAAVYEGLQALGGKQVALRHTVDGTPSMEDLMAAVDALVARKRIQQRDDPEDS
jgi:hypothetical protein